MPKYISKKSWQKFENVINNFIDQDAGQQPFKWLKYIDVILPYAEDSGEEYEVVNLKGLFHYNHIRVWPYSKPTISGDIDTTSVVLYISKNNLKGGGYLTSDGYWDFNQTQDRFILNGHVYKPSGDTQVSQASDNPLLFFVVLQRDDAAEESKILAKYNI